MTITTAPAATAQDVAERDTLTDARSADAATGLIAALTAMPADHPGRPALRDRAIEAWLPLARHLAKRYSGRGELTDDLVQTATVGLIKAVDRFDASRGVDFAGYAIPTIVGEVKRHFRDRTWSIRVPRRLQEMRLAISEANNTLTHKLGRSPLVADIAAYLGVTEEEVLEGLEGARAYSATSLSTPIGPDGGTELGDTISDENNDYDEVDLRASIGPALAMLDAREQRIISLRFYGNLTQSQIADQLGISQMHVSRLLTKALTKLRGHMDVAAFS
ncbi:MULTISPECIES: SigB/SigF/SigG family RNA polymerase sigma factor [Catenuloplanes]|uniref:RNA polymerase sigma-B factor n=1 Tax=Catenuloplanes niger TaxID=587534 RepID=A0AAE3ZKB8_9ACTN|nr:SigB/SigF/SigG family RNA polymerase sigma factor [Catenuloplanes niger]MDR7320225.1 RNA polymerase sigma-B factor [Catenuloplanes niger]